MCASAAERAIVEAEGSLMGPLLRAINLIAAQIEMEFPHVLVDTLAYGASRATPKRTVPRQNVVIRLCSSESNFAVPMTDPSNVAFQTDMESWARVCNRTYIWSESIMLHLLELTLLKRRIPPADYVTNFAAYCLPFPNYYSLGPK